MGRPMRASLGEGPADGLSPGGFPKKPMHFAARSKHQNVAAADVERFQIASKVGRSLHGTNSIRSAFQSLLDERHAGAAVDMQGGAAILLLLAARYEKGTNERSTDPSILAGPSLRRPAGRRPR